MTLELSEYRTKYLNSEEKDLDVALNKVNVKKLERPTPGEQKLFKKTAKEFLKKETKMNIRIDSFERTLSQKCFA